MEVESVEQRLLTIRGELLSYIKQVSRQAELPYTGISDIRMLLNDCEWQLYSFISTLDMFDEIRRKRCSERSGGVASFSVKTPQLIGIRVAMHHNGLIGLNVLTGNEFPETVVGYFMEDISATGDWSQAPFNSYFPANEGFSPIYSLVDNSEEPIKNVTDRLQKLIASGHDDDELRQARSVTRL